MTKKLYLLVAALIMVSMILTAYQPTETAEEKLLFC